jgi:hypothetical protein
MIVAPSQQNQVNLTTQSRALEEGITYNHGDFIILYAHKHTTTRRAQQWGECSISNHNPQGLEMAQRITTCCHGPGYCLTIEGIHHSFDSWIENSPSH